MLSVYTSADEVRRELGVERDELSDEALALPIYERALVADIEDAHLGILPSFNTLRIAGTLSAEEERFVSAVHVFSTYSVARHLTVSLPLFAPRSVEDGKSRIERFSDPYKTTIAGINAACEKWKSRMLAAYDVLSQTDSAALTREFFSVSSAATDPITGT